MNKLLILITLLLIPHYCVAIKAHTQINDPFDSGILSYHQVTILGNPKKIQYNNALIIDLPSAAENALQTPVHIDATQLKGTVEEIVAFVDYGPIPEILRFYPLDVEAKLSFRFKVDQSTVVRAAARTNDGRWHIAGKFISAAGGGCSMPALAYADDDWTETLGTVRGKFWPKKNRLRFTVDHPMDTGLANNIPVFIVEDLKVNDKNNRTIAQFKFKEPVSEDPAISLYLKKKKYQYPIIIDGRDNNGNLINVKLPLTLN